MDRERLDEWCERGILGLVLAMLVYSPLAFGAVRAVDQVVIQSLTCVALLLWAVRMWVNPRYRLLWPPICWAVLTFLAYAVFRYWTADIEYVSRQEVLKVGVYASVFFLILNNCHSQVWWTAMSEAVAEAFCCGAVADAGAGADADGAVIR
jgi:hypothetical protein